MSARLLIVFLCLLGVVGSARAQELTSFPTGLRTNRPQPETQGTQVWSGSYTYRWVDIHDSKLSRSDIRLHISSIAIGGWDKSPTDFLLFMGMRLGWTGSSTGARATSNVFGDDGQRILAREGAGKCSLFSVFFRGAHLLQTREPSFWSPYLFGDLELGFFFPRYLVEEGALGRYERSTGGSLAAHAILTVGVKVLGIEISGGIGRIGGLYSEDVALDEHESRHGTDDIGRRILVASAGLSLEWFTKRTR